MDMECSLWKDLLSSISSYFGVSSCSNFDSELVQKAYQNVGETLELLKSIADPIFHTNVASDDKFRETLQKLVRTVDECRGLFEDWHPLASKAHLALEADLLMARIQNSGWEIVCLLKDSCPELSSIHLEALEADLLMTRIQNSGWEIVCLLKDSCPELSSIHLEGLQVCIQKKNSAGSECEFASAIIKKALTDQAAASLGPSIESLEKIAGCLGLRSNLEILVEILALEKLKNAKKVEKWGEAEYIEELITLFTSICNHLCALRQSRNQVLVPSDFCCPLSLELMTDPVIVASGQTYERASITKWLDLGLTVCPMTRQTLAHTIMIPNYTCKALIINWCEKNNIELPDDPMKSSSEQFKLLFSPRLSEVVEDHRVKKLVEDLNSNSIESLREATARVLLFSKQNMENRILVAEYGGIRLLVNLLHSSDPKIQEDAVTTLLYLAINNDNKIAITDSGAIQPLIHVLQTGSSEAQESSAATLFCLSMIHENKSRIGRSGAIGPLVELLAKGTPLGKKNATILLFNLSICHENRTRIVQAGAVKLLVDLINDPVSGIADKAVAVLESLSRIYEARVAIGQAGGIPVLVNVLELGCMRGKENAAGLLLRLCVNDSRYCKMVLMEDILPSLVLLSLSGTPAAREKAMALLSYLRNLM